MKPIRRSKKSKVNKQKDKLRLSVFRSNTDIYVQIIDDVESKTLASASSLKLSGSRSENAEEVGKLIAEEAKKLKIDTVVFDRGNYIYHGRIEKLANSARKNGLRF